MFAILLAQASIAAGTAMAVPPSPSTRVVPRQTPLKALPRLTEPFVISRDSRLRVTVERETADTDKVPALNVSPNGCGITGAPVCPRPRRVLFRSALEN